MNSHYIDNPHDVMGEQPAISVPVRRHEVEPLSSVDRQQGRQRRTSGSAGAAQFDDGDKTSQRDHARKADRAGHLLDFLLVTRRDLQRDSFSVPEKKP